MSKLEKPRHGWEGISNGGEIYGNRWDLQNKSELTYSKLETFNNMISKGMDRIMAYQIVYHMSFDEAKNRALLDKYNILISGGVPHEVAKKIVYGSNGNSLKSK